MSWVPLTGYEKNVDLKDEPRKLTKQEIEHVVAHIPLAPSADSTAAIVAREGIIEWIENVLSEVKIAPSAIPELIQKILEQHYKSLAVPGTPVGITAAEAVGSTTTQMTLNSVAPHEKIFLQDNNGNGQITEIGKWIDSLLEKQPEKIVLIPENRTQYLKLDEPVFIATPDKFGKVSWDEVTAVTKHLPIGDLVKITTYSGREVTVTRSKSLLTYDGTELIQEEGKNAKVGTLVPILFQIPGPERVITFINTEDTKLFFTPDFGFLIGNYLSSGTILKDKIVFDGDFSTIAKWCLCNGIETENKTIKSKTLANFFSKWLGPKDSKRIPEEILLASEEMIISVLDGLFCQSGYVIEEYNYISLNCEKNILQGVAHLCSRLGIFGRYVQVSERFYAYLITSEDAVGYANVVGCSDFDKFKQMKNLQGKRRGNIRLENTILDPIISVETVLATEFVYDLTVPSTTNFSIFGGLGVADTFHSSGSSKSVSFGIDAIKDIIYARKNLKNEGCTIYFKNTEMTYEEVLNTRTYIVGSVVSDFVKDHEIDEIKSLSHFWWHDSAKILASKDISPENTIAMRLILNVDQMYKHKVTIKDLADTLEREIPRSTVAVYGPISDGIIDLYPDQRMQSEFFGDTSRVSFFENSVLPELKNIRVKGIQNIRELVPVVAPVWSVVLQEKMITDDDVGENEKLFRPFIKDKTGWLLYYNTPVMRSTGLTIQNLGKLCQLSGFKIIGDLGICLAVGAPEPSKDPSAIVTAKISKERKERNDKIKKLTDETLKRAQTLPEAQKKALIRKPIIVPRTPLMVAAEFVYADTVGSNLKDLLSLSNIDKTRTTCNNMHTIAETLGIETARTYVVRALNNIISNAGSYVHPTNITLIAEFIVSRGEPHGATYAGISRQPGGHLSLATLERAGQVIIQSAVTARKEDIRNVSASVVVGTRMAIGNGFFDVGQDIIVDGVKKTIVNDDLFTGFKLDDDNKQYPKQQSEENLDDAIKMLGSFTVGDGFLQAGEGDNDEETEDEINLLNMFDQEIVTEKKADTLTQVKIGIPIDVIETLKPVPIISRGLIEVTNIIPPRVNIDTSLLQQMLNRVKMDPIKKLPPPTGKNLFKAMTNLRKTQIGELK